MGSAIPGDQQKRHDDGEGDQGVRYRGFNLHAGAEPVFETLLGRITQWSPTGSIAYLRRAGSLVEVTRFRLAGMTFNDEAIAAWFGLEIARLAVDSCCRDFVIARYETEKRLVERDRLRR